MPFKVGDRVRVKATTWEAIKNNPNVRREYVVTGIFHDSRGGRGYEGVNVREPRGYLGEEYLEAAPLVPVQAPVKPPPVIPQEDARRKAAPVFRAILETYPAALFLMAEQSLKNDHKHNPERPDAERPVWSHERSGDHEDCLARHLSELHTDEEYHRIAIAIRGLMQLQEYAVKKLGWGQPKRMVDG